MVKYSQPELKFWLASLVSTVLAQQQTCLKKNILTFICSQVFKVSAFLLPTATLLFILRGARYTKFLRTPFFFLPPLNYLKAGFSSSKKSCLIWLNESPLKMMKSTFYFALKLLFFFKTLKVFVLAFQSCRKNSLIRKIRFLSKFMTS